ncbi:MAG: hypothetical protein DWI59_03200 [Chloroflexi bacterium]|nr:MAG: hypothetical protein DWI59_03200 [Chloroflexota bacterium]
MPTDQVVDRIPLHRSVAVVTEDTITVGPGRAQLVGAVIELAIAALAVAAIVFLFDWLPLAVLMVLLLVALFLGPVGILGLVYGAMGASFVMERAKGSARWQQGFLGLGIGTVDGVGFGDVARLEVTGDFERELTDGDRQDVVHWEIRLVKANGRVLNIGVVVAARPLAAIGLERANRLCEAVAAMAGVEARAAVLPLDAPEATAESAVAPAPARSRRRYRRVPGSSEAE